MILSLCDLTATAVLPWAEGGHDCVCVDTQYPSYTFAPHPCGHPNIVACGLSAHQFKETIQRMEVEFLFAFPPCTGGAVSGARHWKRKGLPHVIQWLQTIQDCLEVIERVDCPWVLEQPVVDSVLHKRWRPPDLYFHPYEYGGYLDPPGDAYTKKTALWVGNGFVMPEPRPVEPQKVCPQGSWIQQLGGSSTRTKNLRSATPPGWAQAVYEVNHA